MRDKVGLFALKAFSAGFQTKKQSGLICLRGFLAFFKTFVKGFLMLALHRLLLHFAQCAPVHGEVSLLNLLALSIEEPCTCSFCRASLATPLPDHAHAAGLNLSRPEGLKKSASGLKTP